MKNPPLKYFDLLGHEVDDVVTGFRGIVTSIGYDLYGCIQCIVTPPVDKEGKPPEGHWRDAKRLKVLSKKPVMEVPNFSVETNENGPEIKPAFSKTK